MDELTYVKLLELSGETAMSKKNKQLYKLVNINQLFNINTF